MTRPDSQQKSAQYKSPTYLLAYTIR